MKVQDFKSELRNALERHCKEKGWKFDNAKHRGMAFEDWCFELFAERYPGAQNDPKDCIIRGDDAGIDVVFDSKETGEIYILQCKHPKIAASDPMPEAFGHFSALITRTLSQSYREILKREEGTAFSLPRDAKVWDLVRTKFNDSLELLRDVA